MSLIKLRGFNYSDDEHRLFQSKTAEFEELLEQGYYVVSQKPGMYEIEKPAIAEVKLEIKGKLEVFDVKNLIKREYNQEKLSRSIFEKFIKDVRNGEKVLCFDKEQGLLIK